jgi:hypothetical protein
MIRRTRTVIPRHCIPNQILQQLFANELELEEQQQFGPPKTSTIRSILHKIVDRRSLRYFQTLVAHAYHIWFPPRTRTSNKYWVVAAEE